MKSAKSSNTSVTRRPTRDDMFPRHVGGTMKYFRHVAKDYTDGEHELEHP